MTTQTQARRPASGPLDRAYAKSEEAFYEGNLPRYLGREADAERWAIASRRVGGTIYLLTVSGGQVVACDCRYHYAACWHRRAVERVLAGDLPYYNSQTKSVQWMQPPAAARVCRRCGQVLAGPACLDCDLAPPPAPARPPLPREAIFGRAVER